MFTPHFYSMWKIYKKKTFRLRSVVSGKTIDLAETIVDETKPSKLNWKFTIPAPKFQIEYDTATNFPVNVPLSCNYYLYAISSCP